MSIEKRIETLEERLEHMNQSSEPFLYLPQKDGQHFTDFPGVHFYEPEPSPLQIPERDFTDDHRMPNQ